MPKSKLKGFEYQKKLVSDFRKNMENNSEYELASIYTVLFSLAIDAGISEVKMLVAELEKDLISNGMDMDSTTKENEKIIHVQAKS